MTHAPALAGVPLDAARFNNYADWGTYTPSLLATTTNPNLGATGLALGSWRRRGHWVTGRIEFLFQGTGLNAGSGNYLIELPFDAHPTFNTFSATNNAGSPAGQGLIRDTDTEANSEIVVLQLVDASNPRLVRMYRNAANTSVTNTTPIPWAAGDRITLFFGYIADPDDLPPLPISQNLWRDGYPIPGRSVEQLDQVVHFEPRLTAAITDPNLGDEGEVVGWYRRSDRWIEGGVRFRFNGSGISAGSGAYRIRLPAAFDTTLARLGGIGAGTIIGDGRIRDNSTAANSRIALLQIFSTSVSIVDGRPTGRVIASIIVPGSNSFVNDSTPFTWAINDRLTFRFAYPTATTVDGSLP